MITYRRLRSYSSERHWQVCYDFFHSRMPRLISYFTDPPFSKHQTAVDEFSVHDEAWLERSQTPPRSFVKIPGSELSVRYRELITT